MNPVMKIFCGMSLDDVRKMERLKDAAIDGGKLNRAQRRNLERNFRKAKNGARRFKHEGA